MSRTAALAEDGCVQHYKLPTVGKLRAVFFQPLENQPDAATSSIFLPQSFCQHRKAASKVLAEKLGQKNLN